MLQRTGLWEPIVVAGGFVGGAATWSSAGWAPVPDQVPEAICLRRARLDPLLRRIASRTPGVDLILGRTVTALVFRDERVEGVRVAGEGAEHEYRARLVVGADRYRSTVAALAGATENRAP